MSIPYRLAVATATFALALGVCASVRADDAKKPESVLLRKVAGDRMAIGAAIQASELEDPRSGAFIAEQFNSLTPGNEMKPDALQKVKGKFTFENADKIVAFAEKHGM